MDLTEEIAHSFWCPCCYLIYPLEVQERNRVAGGDQNSSNKTSEGIGGGSDPRATIRPAGWAITRRLSATGVIEHPEHSSLAALIEMHTTHHIGSTLTVVTIFAIAYRSRASTEFGRRENPITVDGLRTDPSSLNMV